MIARQNERRLEESKVESSQLRNRLTLIEKNISDPDPEAKMHRKLIYQYFENSLIHNFKLQHNKYSDILSSPRKTIFLV